ncbi:MAG: general secretion pathway protein GspC [Candidatus Binatia bacterium]|nr:MAG: general secretion pathway protein GspC [Candidatus Binatia bacterium]
MKLSPRHLIWVNFLLLTLVAYLGASAVSAAIAARLAVAPEVHLKPPPPPIQKPAKRPLAAYAAISSRDIFNPAKPVEEVKVEAPPPPTKLNLKLWGVSLHTQGPSYCVIEDLASHKQDVYRVGDQVPGSATVKAINWDHVVLDRGGFEEVLEMAQPGGGLPGGVPSVGGQRVIVNASFPSAIPDPSAPPAAQNPYIQQVGENEFHIDRAEVDRQLDNMNQLLTQMRAVPHFENGRSTGFRLFAIRQGSIFEQLGLRNGDVIQSINGQDLSDPAKALALFQELRNASEIKVAGVRNKQPFETLYRIR